MVEISSEIIEITHRAVRCSSALGRVHAAYLFGSQVTGTADEWSDIDIALFVDGSEQWDFTQRTQAMVKVARECGEEVEAHFFPGSDADRPEKGSFAEWVIKHGRKVE